MKIGFEFRQFLKFFLKDLEGNKLPAEIGGTQQKTASEALNKVKTTLGLILDDQDADTRESILGLEEILRKTTAEENVEVEIHFLIGVAYIANLGVQQDLVKGRKYLEKLVHFHLKYAYAIFFLGWCYQGTCLEGYQGICINKFDRDLIKARTCFQEAVDLGCIPALSFLGEIYYYGKGVSKDIPKAVELYNRGAKAGWSLAQNALADHHRCKLGKEPDLKIAFDLYEQASNQDYTEADYNLGFCLHYGKGVKKDLIKAFSLFEKAAAQGHTQAEAAVGTCIAHGHGTGINQKVADEYFRKAAEKGNGLALFNLGISHEKSASIEDKIKAVEYFLLATFLGYKNSKDHLKRNSLGYFGDEIVFDRIIVLSRAEITKYKRLWNQSKKRASGLEQHLSALSQKAKELEKSLVVSNNRIAKLKKKLGASPKNEEIKALILREIEALILREKEMRDVNHALENRCVAIASLHGKVISGQEKQVVLLRSEAQTLKLELEKNQLKHQRDIQELNDKSLKSSEELKKTIQDQQKEIERLKQSELRIELLTKELQAIKVEQAKEPKRETAVNVILHTSASNACSPIVTSSIHNANTNENVNQNSNASLNSNSNNLVATVELNFESIHKEFPDYADLKDRILKECSDALRVSDADQGLFKSVLEKESEEQKKINERQYINSDPMLSDYYYFFQLQFNDTLLAFKVLHSRRVDQNNPNALATMADGLKTISKHVPVAGILFDILGSLIKTLTEVQQRELINRTAGFIVGAAEIEAVGEELARLLTLSQIPVLHKKMYEENAGFFKRKWQDLCVHKDKLIANDINTNLRKLADTQFKRLCAAIFEGHINATNRDIESLLRIILDSAYCPAEIRDKKFREACNSTGGQTAAQTSAPNVASLPPRPILPQYARTGIQSALTLAETQAISGLPKASLKDCCAIS